MLPKLPAPILDILGAIRCAGGQGYVVGGALRDLMLGVRPTDWDVAATLPQVTLMAALPGAKDIGGRLGTVRVSLPGGSCDITPCRGEADYADRRHPSRVWLVPNILTDLSRRDFTINAMAYNGEILLDPFSGREHLRQRLLCCVGEPALRFAEDPLRILRLFRFSATLGFTAEWRTYVAASRLAESIALLSRERVRDEVQKILMSDGPQVLGALIAKGGLVHYGFEFAPSLATLAEVPGLPHCRWWALISLCGADRAAVIQAFGLSRRFLGELDELARLYRLGPSVDKTFLKQKIRNTKLDYAPIAATFAAVTPAFMAEPVLFAGVQIKKEPYRIEDLAVDGGMLAEEGIRGAACGRVLDELLGAVIQNPALNQTPVLLGLARGLRQIL